EWDPCRAGSAVIVTVNADYLLRTDGFICLYPPCESQQIPHVVNEQGNQNNDVEDVGNQNDDAKDAGNNVTKEGVADGQEILVDAGIVRIEDEVSATVVNNPKGTRKKSKTTSGASGYALPPKRLREDYGTSGDAGASTAEKSLTVLQDLLRSDHTDSIIGLNLRTQHPTERSSVPPPLVLTAVVATTTIIGVTSTPIHELGTGLTYIPKWNVINDSALDDPKTAKLTIVGRMWIFGRGLRLIVMKCLQSPKYLVTLRGAIGRAIDKGMQDGLAAGIDHGKVGRGLVDVDAYNPFA
nr:hypothetical protein [Tanacetum cinerariifolium]